MSSKLGDLVASSPPIMIQPGLALTTSVTSSTVDMLQRDGIGAAFLFVGLVSGNTPTLAITLQESTDGTTWTEVIGPNGTTAGTFPTQTTSNTTAGLLFQRQARYLRATQVVGGTGSPNFVTTLSAWEMYKALTPNPGA